MTDPGLDQLRLDHLRRHASAPLVTFYDDPSGERTELSARTIDNWIAKTVNLLNDELDLRPGAVVALRLPLHWLVPVWLGACWAAGAIAWPWGDPASADLAVVGPAEADAAPRAPETLVCSLTPLAQGSGRDLGPGITDYDTAVRVHGDQAPVTEGLSGTSPALRLGPGAIMTAAEVIEAARQRGDTWGLANGGRLASTLALRPGGARQLAAVLACLPVPLVADGSVVLTAHADPAVEAARHAAELVTAVAG